MRAAGRRVVVATPRILKPDEQRLWLFYLRLNADALLLRRWGTAALICSAAAAVALLLCFALLQVGCASISRFISCPTPIIAGPRCAPVMSCNLPCPAAPGCCNTSWSWVGQVRVE